jgi:hypothetical protein
MDITLNLDRPHVQQLAFMRSNAKRRVIVAGRRGGKTTGVAMLAVEAMLDGRRVLEAAPTSDQTTAFWETCRRYVAPLVDRGLIVKHETTRTLDAWNGGRIRAKTAFNADTLRGDYADLLILDEYSLMSVDTWEEVGAPMLLDNDGDAVFIFTPKRRNHAYRHYMRATADNTGRWASWHFKSTENPHLSVEALQEITSDMTAEAYRQEILAEFLEGEGAVFRNIYACLHAPETTPGAHAGHHIVSGIDWAKHSDYTAISVGCATCRQELALDRFNKIDFVFQRGRLVEAFRRWSIDYGLAETNSIGEPNLEILQREGLPIGGFQTTSASKPPLIENLALCLEREEWQFLNLPFATVELEAYEQKVNPMGRSSYSAPEGMHDDTVIARALMVRAANNAAWLIS